tara:strand:- start:6904 stop:7311 length:408 start_codon:yes stop_codon:yes gene_type:complete
MSCGNQQPYSNVCRTDIPFPQVSPESVPSQIENLVAALFGTITKEVAEGRVVWVIPCDTAATNVAEVTRNVGEGLLCYLIRILNTLPVWRGLWSSAIAYPIGSVVSNGTELYQANLAVPVGTLLSNPTYWQLVLS